MSAGESDLAPAAQGGFVKISVATAIGGAIGYLITWLVPRSIGFSEYAIYAFFWSFLFLIVGTLSGLQHEVTRATRARSTRQTGIERTNMMRFAAILASSFAVLIIVSSPTWQRTAFGEGGGQLVWPLAAGAFFYILTAVVAGTLYGLSNWSLILVLIAGDAILRLASISVALLAGVSLTGLAWAVAIPFPLTLLVLGPWLVKAIRGRAAIDVSVRRLTWNVARTVVASGSLGVMVSGFPLILGLTSSSIPKVEVGMVVLAVTLTRAPLIVVVMALQSYLVIYFRGRRELLQSSLVKIVLLILAAGGILGLAGLWLGQWVFALLFPGQPVPTGIFIAGLVISSALVGIMCATGPALLSIGRHSYYVAGWAVGALSTVACLLLPLDLISRTLVALLAPPILALCIHAVGLARGRFLGTA
jgi:O-antigen/teichoic acid export membrane protein